jgi:hypothetical protein
MDEFIFLQYGVDRGKNEKQKANGSFYGVITHFFPFVCFFIIQISLRNYEGCTL